MAVDQARAAVLAWLGPSGAAEFSDGTLVDAASARAARDFNLKLVTHWSPKALAFQARWERPNGLPANGLTRPFEHEHLEGARLLACAAAVSVLAR